MRSNQLDRLCRLVDGEVIDSRTRETSHSPNGAHGCKKESEESSCSSSELVESESDEAEIQSAKSTRGNVIPLAVYYSELSSTQQ